MARDFITQNSMQFKTYELFIAGIFHLNPRIFGLWLTTGKQICSEGGLLHLITFRKSLLSFKITYSHILGVRVQKSLQHQYNAFQQEKNRLPRNSTLWKIHQRARDEPNHESSFRALVDIAIPFHWPKEATRSSKIISGGDKYL